jgi:allophanate hydrolase subunit 2
VVSHHEAGGPFLDDDTKMTLSIHPRRYGLIQIKEASQPACAGADQVPAGDQPQDAKALGLDVSLQMQQRADEVIE